MAEIIKILFEPEVISIPLIGWAYIVYLIVFDILEIIADFWEGFKD
jgi:hypothetical protein